MEVDVEQHVSGVRAASVDVLNEEMSSDEAEQERVQRPRKRAHNPRKLVMHKKWSDNDDYILANAWNKYILHTPVALKLILLQGTVTTRMHFKSFRPSWAKQKLRYRCSYLPL